jgi:hypothetical protein
MYPLAKEIPPDICPDSLIAALDHADGQHKTAKAARAFKGCFVSELMTWKRMNAKEHSGTQVPRPLYISNGPLEGLCAMLLSLMPRLRALNLFISFIPQLPPFQELRHLELHAVKFSGIQAAVLGMPVLETLFLSCEHEEAMMAELDLEQLPQLLRLRLDNVFPKRLRLPRGCRLDLSGEAAVIDEAVARGGWADALGKLRACTCAWTIVRKTGLRFHTVSSLPVFLSLATSLEELSLHGHGEVDFSIVSRGLLSCDSLTSLWMKSDSMIFFHLPAGLRPRRMEVYAPSVRLEFDDLRSSVGRLEALCIVSRTVVLPDNLKDELLLNSQPLVYTYLKELNILHFKNDQAISSGHHVNVYSGAEKACRCCICWTCLLRHKRL